MRMRIDGSQISIAIAGTGLFACLAAAVALAFPQSNLAPLSGLGPVHEARAHALSSPADVRPEALAQAVRETRASLRQAPANPTAWLRLAYLDSEDGDGFGQDGNLALSRSYAVAPFGPDDTPWRLMFAFNHWTELDPANRIRVLEELRWARTTGRLKVSALQERIGDPAGRLALNLTLELDRGQRPVPASRTGVPG